ncbi:MAG: hypothetical protein SFX73_20605 [Kofleriaceae bacterium]|nr:hypothetical protein [Kofleriaceae bacterium]
MRTWRISLALVAACGGSAKQASAPVTAAPTCKSAAEHMIDELASTKDPRPSDDIINKQIALIRTRCEQDAWSPEAVQCLAAMQGTADADRCATMLTEAQQGALVRDQEEAAGHKAEPSGEEEGAMGRAAAPPPPPAPAAAAATPPPVPMPATRGPKPKGAGRAEDPDQGGE